MKSGWMLALVAVMAVWGLNFVIIKAGLEQFPPLMFVALRFTLTALLLVPFLGRRRGSLRPLLGLSLTLGVLHFGLMFSGLARIDAATASIAVQLQVPFAALLAALVLKDRLGWRRMTGMAFAFAGEPRFEGGLAPLLLVVTAACRWSVSSVQIKLLEDDIHPLTLNGWVAVLAAPQMIAATLLLEEGQVAAAAAADWRAWGAVLYQAILVTLFGYGVWYRMMQRHEVNQVMPFTLLVPVFGVASGVLALGERLTLPMLIGGGATILGVAIITVHRPRVIEPTTRGGL
jgi:O-acetylserine/cysteine efflux transporter